MFIQNRQDKAVEIDSDNKIAKCLINKERDLSQTEKRQSTSKYQNQAPARYSGTNR